MLTSLGLSVSLGLLRVAQDPAPPVDPAAPPPPSAPVTPAHVELVTPAPPAPCPTYIPEPKTLRSARGMMAAGITLGVVSYLSTSMAGAVAIDRARDLEDDPLTEADESAHASDRRAFGRALLIPIVGPYVAIPRADTALRGWAAGLSGVAQGVALGLTIAGIVRRSRALRPSRVAVSPIAGREGAGISMRVRF